MSRSDFRAPLRTVAIAGTAFLIVGAFAATDISCTQQKTIEEPNTLHLPLAESIKGFDPAFADDAYSAAEIGRVYDTLMGYHYLKRPYELIPVLAESMPTISKDRKEYLFELKKGVLFHDDPAFKATQGKGRELVAEDVEFSLKRVADPFVDSTGWWVFDGKIAGLNDWREEAKKAGKANYQAQVSGLKALDRYKLKIQLTQPSPQFLHTLTMAFASIVPHEAVEHYGANFSNHPVGTGAFRLKEFKPASKIVYVRNPTYRGDLYPSEGEPSDKKAGLLKDAAKPLPFLNRVVVHIFSDHEKQWELFKEGKLAWSPVPKEVFKEVITPLKELVPDLIKAGVVLNKIPLMDVTHETFNLRDPLIGPNKALRQALSLAYDIDPFIEIFYTGRAVPAQGPIPPGLPGHNSKFANPYRQFNPVRAKELLKEAGFPEGVGLPAIEYLILADQTASQRAELLELAFARIGVRLKVRSLSWSEFHKAIRNGEGQMWGIAWRADYPDAENFLQLFYSKNIQHGANDSGYSHPEYDVLYEKALTLPPGKERDSIYRQMVSLLAEDVPWIFGVHRVGYEVSHSWLKNYKPHHFDRSAVKYLRVDESASNMR